MLAIEKFIGIYKNIDTFKEKTLFRINIANLNKSLLKPITGICDRFFYTFN